MAPPTPSKRLSTAPRTPPKRRANSAPPTPTPSKRSTKASPTPSKRSTKASPSPSKRCIKASPTLFKRSSTTSPTPSKRSSSITTSPTPSKRLAMATPMPKPSSPPSGSTIQVVVRLRPMNEKEKSHGTLPVVTAKTQEKTVTVIKGKGPRQIKSSYSFDNVFTAFSTQEEVFDATVKPVISDVMRGYESTVFAYGQTGTGKTHTMEGSLSSPELHGVIPRSAQAIFEHLKQPQYKEHNVTCSYLEIYNEELRDLLDDVSSKPNEKPPKLEIMEGKNGTFCRGLIEKEVTSAEDVLTLMQNAQHQRMVGETKMNKASSRSHCLFTIQVHGKLALLEGDGLMQFNGKLHMVDLAGSECAKSAGNDKGTANEVARERERMNINRSLLTLGRVISILKERSENKNANARIPYRDSKLTRILQESLGGRCKTVIVATLSPSITAIEESLSTLNYAQSANGIVNKPVSSSLISLSQNHSMLPPMEKTSDEYNSIESWQEMEMRLQYMQAQVEEAQAALARKHLMQQELQDRADKAEAELLEYQQKLYDAGLEIKSLKGVVESETTKRKQTEHELRETQLALKKKSLILKATQATESALTLEAESLIETLEKLSNDRNDMHSLVVSHRDLESERRKATKQFQEATLSVLSNIESAFTKLNENIALNQSNAVEIATWSHGIGHQSVKESQELLAGIANNVSCVTSSIKAQLMDDGGMVPFIEAESESVLTDLKSANSMFSNGEDELAKAHDDTRRRLDECAKKMDGSATSIQMSSNQTLQRFEAKINESQDAISSLIGKVKSSLLAVSTSKAETNKAMHSLMEQWRDQSLGSTGTILDISSTRCEMFKKCINQFQEGMLHHENIMTSLGSQKEFLTSSGAAHVNAIDQHRSMLDAHREKLSDSHKAQNKLRNEVMQSIMSGVEALVSSEIGKLANSEKKYFELLDNGGADLAKTNEQLAESAKQVMENIQSTNEFVSNEASTICNNDAKARGAMESTRDTLNEVITASTSHRQLVTDFSLKGFAYLSEMKDVDGQSSEIAKMVQQDGEACSTSLVSGILNPTSSEMNVAIQSGLDALAYVKDGVICDVNGALDDIARKRHAVATQINDKYKSTCSRIVNQRQTLVEVAKAQSYSAGKLRDEILSASNNHNEKTVPHYYSQLDAGKDRLVCTMNNMTTSSNQILSEGKAQGDIATQSIEDFAQNKMQCNEPVAAAPAKKDCSYRSELSSTPAEDEILSEMNSDIPEGNNTLSPAADSFKENSPEDDASQEDENRSRKSSGSNSSVPSPALKPRDMNANYGELRKNHRSSTSSFNRKMKASMGLSSSSRKKMKR